MVVLSIPPTTHANSLNTQEANDGYKRSQMKSIMKLYASERLEHSDQDAVSTQEYRAVEQKLERSFSTLERKLFENAAEEIPSHYKSYLEEKGQDGEKTIQTIVTTLSQPRLVGFKKQLISREYAKEAATALDAFEDEVCRAYTETHLRCFGIESKKVFLIYVIDPIFVKNQLQVERDYKLLNKPILKTSHCTKQKGVCPSFSAGTPKLDIFWKKQSNGFDHSFSISRLALAKREEPFIRDKSNSSKKNLYGTFWRSRQPQSHCTSAPDRPVLRAILPV